MLQLITILNRCHRFPGFVYQRACFSSDHKSIEVAVRPRKGSAAICSRCHQLAPGYDQLAERRGLTTGEKRIVPRVCDLNCVIASCRGKIEMTLAEEEGAEDKLIKSLVGEAVKAIFARYDDAEAHDNSLARIFPRLGETATTDAVLALVAKTQ